MIGPPLMIKTLGNRNRIRGTTPSLSLTRGINTCPDSHGRQGQSSGAITRPHATGSEGLGVVRCGHRRQPCAKLLRALVTAQALDVDWKLYGWASVVGDSACFYDA